MTFQALHRHTKALLQAALDARPRRVLRKRCDAQLYGLAQRRSFNVAGTWTQRDADCCCAGCVRRARDACQGSLRHGSAAGAVLEAALSSRFAIRTDPDLARKDCPPSDQERTEDTEIARYLLEHKSFYSRALKDGGPAIAER